MENKQNGRMAAVHTLGCKVNQCDTENLLARLAEAGYVICNFDQIADVYIINTCTVTHVGDKKSLQMIRRARKQNPSAFIAVCGCMPRSQTDSVERICHAGADFIFDTRKPNELLVKLDAVLSDPSIMVDFNDHEGQDATLLYQLDRVTSVLKERTRAFIKIQDGCDRYCAYCIVPYVRGPVASRSPSEILTEAKAHISRGIQEIVLTGIQIGAYGYDTDSKFIALPDLINELAKLSSSRQSECISSKDLDRAVLSAPFLRLRLSSIDPWAVDDALLSAISDSPTLCSHFHLSLQSGSDKTLARMNRRYTTSDYVKAAEKLKKIRPNMALTTDVIVGFPGETEDEFKESINFIQKMCFAQIHVFEYSQRACTAAAEFPNQIPNHIKSSRGTEMRALAKELQQNFLRKQIGTTAAVLFEAKINKSPETWQGHTENYCMVQVQGTNLANTIQNVRINGIAEDGLFGDFL